MSFLSSTVHFVCWNKSRTFFPVCRRALIEIDSSTDLTERGHRRVVVRMLLFESVHTILIEFQKPFSYVRKIHLMPRFKRLPSRYIPYIALRFKAISCSRRGQNRYQHVVSFRFTKIKRKTFAFRKEIYSEMHRFCYTYFRSWEKRYVFSIPGNYENCRFHDIET